MPLRSGFHLGWFSSPLELLSHGQFGLVVAVVVDLVGLSRGFGGNLSARVVVASLTVGHVVQGVLSCWFVAKGVGRGLVVVLPSC